LIRVKDTITPITRVLKLDPRRALYMWEQNMVRRPVPILLLKMREIVQEGSIYRGKSKDEPSESTTQLR
jgi:hypothetical protein